MQPPKTITFLSDGCIAELSLKKSLKNKDGEEFFWYRYIKSPEPNNKEFTMGIHQIEKLISLKLLITE